MHPEHGYRTVGARRAGVRLLAAGWLLLGALLIGACGGDGREGLEAFERDWHAALRQNRPEELYRMLDPQSQQRVMDELNFLRAFDPDQQHRVMRHLGGVRAESFVEISPDRYFAMWWRHKTNLQPIDATFDIEPAARSGRVTVEVDGSKQEFAIRFEAGRWMWFLPRDRIMVRNESRT